MGTLKNCSESIKAACNLLVNDALKDSVEECTKLAEKYR
jgi:hypothetical protein